MTGRRRIFESFARSWPCSLGLVRTLKITKNYFWALSYPSDWGWSSSSTIHPSMHPTPPQECVIHGPPLLWGGKWADLVEMGVRVDKGRFRWVFPIHPRLVYAEVPLCAESRNYQRNLYFHQAVGSLL